MGIVIIKFIIKTYIRRIAHLNLALLEENSRLRQQLNHLKHEFMIQNIEELHSIDGNKSLEQGCTENILQQVEHIFNDGKRMNVSSFVVSTETQTDEDTLSEKNLKFLVCELRSQIESLTNSLSIEKMKYQESETNLHALKSDILGLENKFTTLSNETHISMTSEQLSRQTIQEQKDLIAQYASQVLDLITQIDTYKKQMDQLEQERKEFIHAQSVLHQMNQSKLIHHLPNSETIQDLGGKSSLIQVLECQWKAYRHQLLNEMDLLRGTIQSKNFEIERLEEDIKKKMITMHDESEWTLLY